MGLSKKLTNALTQERAHAKEPQTDSRDLFGYVGATPANTHLSETDDTTDNDVVLVSKSTRARCVAPIGDKPRFVRTRSGKCRPRYLSRQRTLI